MHAKPGASYRLVLTNPRHILTQLVTTGSVHSERLPAPRAARVLGARADPAIRQPRSSRRCAPQRRLEPWQDRASIHSRLPSPSRLFTSCVYAQA
jgi:hypothetical protein